MIGGGILVGEVVKGVLQNSFNKKGWTARSRKPGVAGGPIRILYIAKAQPRKGVN